MARIQGAGAVRVEGLAELRRSLGQIDKQLPKNLRVRLKKIGDVVAADARAHMPALSGRARASVKSGASGNSAYVQEGSSQAPYVGWLDYGGTLKPTGRRHNTIRRERVPKGRYLYPAVDRNKDRIVEEATRAFEDTARELGLK